MVVDKSKSTNSPQSTTPPISRSLSERTPLGAASPAMGSSVIANISALPNLACNNNCNLVWVRSPHLEANPHNDGRAHEVFLVTTRPVRAGEELMWSYNVAQSHRG
jgi:hypothetical protein